MTGSMESLERLVQEAAAGQPPLPLPSQVVAVLPPEPDSQLQLAHQIAAHAYTQKVQALEAAAEAARQTAAQRAEQVRVLESRLTACQLELQAASDRAAQAEQRATCLEADKAALSAALRQLGRDLARLEGFRRNLLVSLQAPTNGQLRVEDPEAALDEAAEQLVANALKTAAFAAAPTPPLPPVPHPPSSMPPSGHQPGSQHHQGSSSGEGLTPVHNGYTTAHPHQPVSTSSSIPQPGHPGASPAYSNGFQHGHGAAANGFQHANGHHSSSAPASAYHTHANPPAGASWQEVNPAASHPGQAAANGYAAHAAGKHPHAAGTHPHAQMQPQSYHNTPAASPAQPAYKPHAARHDAGVAQAAYGHHPHVGDILSPAPSSSGSRGTGGSGSVGHSPAGPIGQQPATGGSGGAGKSARTQHHSSWSSHAQPLFGGQQEGTAGGHAAPANNGYHGGLSFANGVGGAGGVPPSPHGTPRQAARGAGDGGEPVAPQLDGREFFRQARARLSAEAFSRFLQAIKELNSGRQSRDQVLATAHGILGGGHPDLYRAFENLLSRHLPPM